MVLVTMAMVLTFSCHTIRQKSVIVLGRGPVCVQMGETSYVNTYANGRVNMSTVCKWKSKHYGGYSLMYLGMQCIYSRWHIPIHIIRAKIISVQEYYVVAIDIIVLTSMYEALM